MLRKQYCVIDWQLVNEINSTILFFPCTNAVMPTWSLLHHVDEDSYCFGYGNTCLLCSIVYKRLQSVLVRLLAQVSYGPYSGSDLGKVVGFGS